MGSFTSAPKIINNDILDKDVNFTENISRIELLQHCQRQPKVHPMFKRAWRAKNPDSNYNLKVRKLNAVSKGNFFRRTKYYIKESSAIINFTFFY